MPATRKRAAWVVLVLIGAAAPVLGAQGFGGAGYMHALDLEQQEHYPEAAAAYRQVLVQSPTSLGALLGLERVYAQLGRSDSLLPILQTAITRRPHVAAIRAAQLRTLRSLGRFDAAREAFQQWRAAWPHDPQPYREYAKMLLQEGLTAQADTVLRQGEADVGGARPFAYEIAQLRAAMGLWEQSGAAWRVAVSDDGYLNQAAVFALTPAPADVRPALRAVLTAPPVTVGARRLLAALDVVWGAPQAGWLAIKQLPPDTAATSAWLDFAHRAEEARAWLTARDALLAVLAHRTAPELAVRAATDALSGGDARSAALLAAHAEAMLDSAAAASTALPVHLRALGALGRPADGERLFAAYQHYVPPDQRAHLVQEVAWGWIRVGNMRKAKALLATSNGGRGGEAAGWIALYEGNLAGARTSLTATNDATPQLVLALALLQRTTADTAASVGAAFLALARADTAAAAAAFERAAASLPDASTLLLATAARLNERRNDEKAMALWQSIVQQHASAPEAPEAELEWARALRRTGRASVAVQRLEHLILTYPESALVPQARRELEQIKGAIPSTS